MAFVYYQQGIGWQIVEQGRRRFTFGTPGQMARVVFDTVAVADLGHHLEIELGALLEPLRLQ